jgi:hypothetical protein
MRDRAQQKAHALDAPARWVRREVLSVPETLDGITDLVYAGCRGSAISIDGPAW